MVSPMRELALIFCPQRIFTIRIAAMPLPVLYLHVTQTCNFSFACKQFVVHETCMTFPFQTFSHKVKVRKSKEKFKICERTCTT